MPPGFDAQGPRPALTRSRTGERLGERSDAQESISAHIENPKVTEIAYKKGSRSCSPSGHLEVVRRHSEGHLADPRKKA